MLADRLRWLKRQVAAGVHLRITAGPGQDSTKCKVRFILEPWKAAMPVATQALLTVLIDALGAQEPEHVCVDRGHKHSSGLSEIAVWLHKPGAANEGPAADQAMLTEAPNDQHAEDLAAPTEEEEEEKNITDAKDVAEDLAAPTEEEEEKNITDEKDEAEQREGVAADEHDGDHEEAPTQDAEGVAVHEPVLQETHVEHREEAPTPNAENEDEQDELQTLTAAASALADRILELDEAIDTCQERFPGGQLQVRQLQRQRDEAMEQYTGMMAEVMALEQSAEDGSEESEGT